MLLGVEIHSRFKVGSHGSQRLGSQAETSDEANICNKKQINATFACMPFGVKLGRHLMKSQ